MSKDSCKKGLMHYFEDSFKLHTIIFYMQYLSIAGNIPSLVFCAITLTWVKDALLRDIVHDITDARNLAILCIVFD